MCNYDYVSLLQTLLYVSCANCHAACLGSWQDAVYMQDLQQLNHPPPSLPLPLPRWPHSQSPVQVSPLSHYLQHHPDQGFVPYVLHGLASGFHIGYSARRVTLRSSLTNHQSSLANPQVISDYNGEEVALGQMVGPLPSAMRSVVHCSPTGLVPSQGSGG